MVYYYGKVKEIEWKEHLVKNDEEDGGRFREEVLETGNGKYPQLN